MGRLYLSAVHLASGRVGNGRRDVALADKRIKMQTRWTGLFGWTRAGDEDIDQPLGALVPVRAGRHVGDADKGSE